MTIESGTYSSSASAKRYATTLIKNEPESTLNIKDGTFSISNASVNSALVLNYGVTNISGGTFKSMRCIEAASASDVEGVVTITGGTFKGTNIDVSISSMNETGKNNTKVIIKGGTFYKQINTNDGRYGGTVEIYGGKFKNDPKNVKNVTIKGTLKKKDNWYTVTSGN